MPSLRCRTCSGAPAARSRHAPGPPPPPAEWRWHRNQDDGPESADSVSIVRNPNCKSAGAARLAAQRAEQQQQQQVDAGEQREQERLLEQGLAAQRSRRSAGYMQRQGEGAEVPPQAQPLCWWRHALGWLAGWARQLDIVA